jgi:hypothetical protein
MIIDYLRSFRIVNIAIFDMTMSIVILAVLLRWLFPSRPMHFAIAWTMVLVLPIAIFFHWWFQVPTMLNYYLGISGKPIRS